MGLKNYQAPILTLAAQYLANPKLIAKCQKVADDLDILRCRCGRKILGATIEERQVTGGKGRGPSG